MQWLEDQADEFAAGVLIEYDGYRRAEMLAGGHPGALAELLEVDARIGTLTLMARKSKQLSPMDDTIATLLGDEVQKPWKSQRDLEAITGISKNRIGIILRKEPPPATIGEVTAICDAIDIDIVRLVIQARGLNRHE